MIAPDETTPPAARKWARMPLALRLELEAAVAGYLQKRQRRHCNLLRDDSRFAPWIGTGLGHRGEKYLDRVIKQVRDAEDQNWQAKRIRHNPLQTAIADEPTPGARERIPAGPGSALTLGELASGPLTIEELHRLTRENLRQIQLQIDACSREGRLVIERDDYLKLIREQRAAIKFAADQSKSLLSIANSEPIVTEIAAWIAEELRPEHPALESSLQARLNRVVQASQGLDLSDGEGQ